MSNSQNRNRPLVANRLPLQHHGMFQSIGHRAWHAYYCLPRDEKGKPPSYRSLEEAHGVANAGLQKMVKGNLRRPGYEVLSKIAAALNVTPHWLQTGEGEPPRTAHTVPPYPYFENSSGLTRDSKAALDHDSKKLANRRLTPRAKRASK